MFLSFLKITEKRKGFSLIELMVTITIISILSAIGYITYSTAQIGARDSRRKQDLRSLQTALELYKQNSSSKLYPVSTTGTSLCCSLSATDLSSGNKGTPWIPELTNSYINAMPSDPTSNNGDPTTAGVYGYAYWSGPTGAGTSLTGGICPTAAAGGGYFVLVTRLENTNDPDRNGLKNYKYCDNTTAVSADANLFVITSQ